MATGVSAPQGTAVPSARKVCGLGPICHVSCGMRGYSGQYSHHFDRSGSKHRVTYSGDHRATSKEKL